MWNDQKLIGGFLNFTFFENPFTGSVQANSIPPKNLIPPLFSYL